MLSSLFVTLFLQYFFENGAVLINCALKPKLGSRTFDHGIDLIPNIAMSGLSRRRLRAI